MTLTPIHLTWLVNTGQRLTTADGKDVTVLKLNHQQNEEILSAWADHFRNHYCTDDEIDFVRRFAPTESLGKKLATELALACMAKRTNKDIR